MADWIYVPISVACATFIYYGPVFTFSSYDFTHIPAAHSNSRLNFGFNMTESQRKKIIIDTDVGIDDAQAILLALADLKTDVIAITCIGGNTSLENGNVEVSFKRTNSLTSLHIVCRNALKVLMIADRLEVTQFCCDGLGISCRWFEKHTERMYAKEASIHDLIVLSRSHPLSHFWVPAAL